MYAGRDKKQQAGQPGAAQLGAEAAAGEEAQVSSKPVEWPMVPPGSKRQRSRLHQTPGSAPPGAAPEDPSLHAVRPPHGAFTTCTHRSMPDRLTPPDTCQELAVAVVYWLRLGDGKHFASAPQDAAAAPGMRAL